MRQGVAGTGFGPMSAQVRGVSPPLTHRSRAAWAAVQLATEAESPSIPSAADGPNENRGSERMALTGERTDAETSTPWNRQVLRANNERVLLDRLRAVGSSSRAELSRLTGLSKPTVSTALAHLERDGLVRRIGSVTSGRGRAAVLYEPDPTAGYVLGVDVGRSWIRVGLADLDGTVVDRRDVPNDAADADSMVTLAATTARDLVERSGHGWTRVVCAVVGSPGSADRETGDVRYAVNLPGWGRHGLVERFRRELDLDLDLLNDANLAALGEYASGAGRGCPLFVYLLAGTGVGAGIVAEGRLFRGAHGAAGEVGYLPLPGSRADAGAHPSAGAEGDAADRLPVGALEHAAGAEGVVADALAAGMTPPSGAPGLSAADVFALAAAGDVTAGQVVEREAGRLAQAVAALAVVLDPELVVLGGGIGHNADLLLDPLQAELARLIPLRPRVEASRLGDDAVLLGALATAAGTARERVFASRTGTRR